MPTQFISHQWPNTSEINLSDLAFSKIIIWNTGFFILACNKDSDVIGYKSYHYPQSLAIETFKNILLDESILAGDEPIQQILIASEQNMLIPKKLYQAEASKKWMQQVFFIDQTTEDVEVGMIAQPASYILDLYRRDRVATLLSISEDATISNIATYIIGQNISPNYNLYINTIGTLAFIQYYKEGKLQTYQVTDASLDSVMHLLSNLQLQQTSIQISLSGCGTELEILEKELANYFTITRTNTETEFLKFLATCE
jgi:hypothetical protein